MVGFAVLGPLEAFDGDARLDLGTPLQRRLIATLLVNVGSVVSLDRLIDELWGDVPPGAATSSLQAYVSNLRRVLEPHRDRAQRSRVLVTEPPGYVLRVEPESIDAVRFESIAREARQLFDAQGGRDALTRADAALALWRGPAYAEFADQEFARAEAVRLETLRSSVEELRVDAMLLVGNVEQGCAEAESLVLREPLREHRHALLMMALYRSGRQAEALRA